MLLLETVEFTSLQQKIFYEVLLVNQSVEVEIHDIRDYCQHGLDLES